MSRYPTDEELKKIIEQMEMQARRDDIAFRHERQMAELIRAVEINTIATVINESNRNYKN